MTESIVERIFETMKEEKITQQQLANELGIGQSTVASWKKRDCPPPINYISKIANILGVTIDYLVTGSNNPTKYKLTTNEQLLIRLYRTASTEHQKLIFNLALGLNDEHYHNDIDPNELLKTLNAK